MTEIQTLTIETVDQPTVIEIATGPQGPSGASWHFGSSNIPEGINADIYLVTQGTTNLGNIYARQSDGSWALEGNIRGAGGIVNSVNGESAANVVIGAGHLTTGSLGDARLSSNVVLANNNQTITGTKTFSAAPVVPDNSFTIDKTSGLQLALNNKAPTVHSHNDLYYTKAESDAQASNSVKYNDPLLMTNPFGGKKLYISQLNNAAFNAHLRWVVTGTLYRSSDDSVASTPTNFTNIFNGEYESSFVVPAGQYLVLSIKPNNSGGYFTNYPYGFFYLSFYHTNIPENVTGRANNHYSPQGVGWKTMGIGKISDSTSATIYRVRNDWYQISEFEFVVRAPTGSAAHITQIDWNLDRTANPNEMPYVDKFKVNNLYHTLQFADGQTVRANIVPQTGRATFTGITLGGADLQGALNAKASATHTHTPASIGAATPADIESANIANRARINHTGTQPASTITGLSAVALSGSAADLTGVLPAAALPPLAISDTFTVASQAAMLALSAQRGDIAIRTDNGRTYILATDGAGSIGNWKELTPAGQVISVAGKSGAVVLVKSDVGLANVDNTSDAAKPISTATATALSGKSPVGHSHTLASLTDITINNIQSGHIISFNGSQWVNVPISAANVGAAEDGHGHNLSDPNMTGILPISKIPTGTTASTVALGNHTHEYNSLGGKPVLGTSAALDVSAAGNAGIFQVVKGNDTRLSDTRLPKAHNHVRADISDFAHSHNRADIIDFAHSHPIGQLPVAPDGASSADWLVRSDDVRLTDARPPTGHIHPVADITGLNALLAGKETPSGAQAKADTALNLSKVYTDLKVADLVDSSPAALNTLNELAAALGDDPNFATTIAGQIGAISTQVGNAEPNITGGTTGQYWRGDKTWQTLSASTIGLGNVNNTSDAAKPISTATQTALNEKMSTKLIDNNVKRYNDVFYWYSIASTTDNLVLETNIGLGAPGAMYGMDISFEALSGGQHTGQLSFYSYVQQGPDGTPGSAHVPSWISYGLSDITVRFAKKNGKLVIIFKNSSHWNYIGLSIPQVRVRYGFPADSALTGWSASYMTEAATVAAYSTSMMNPHYQRNLYTAIDGKAAAQHAHALTDSSITGVLPIAQVPTGTTASTVALGNHTHALTDSTITGILPDAQLPGRLRAAATASTVSNPDTAVESGFYYWTSAGANLPGTSAVATPDAALEVISHSASWVTQTARDWRTNGTWVRNKNNGVWGSWVMLVRSDDSRMTNARTPTTHGHNLSDANMVGVLPLDQSMMPQNNNHLRGNLGSPSTPEMALIDGQMTNKLMFKLPDSIEYSINGTTYLPHPTATNSVVIKAMVTGSGAPGSGLSITNGWHSARMTFTRKADDWSGWYVYLNAMYMYYSSNGHQVKVLVEKSTNGTDWTTHSDTNNVSGWPGHAFLSHSTIPWSNTPQTAGHFSHIRITFIPTWNSAHTGAVNIQKLEWWGGYPTGSRGLMTWDFDKNVIFPSDVYSGGQALIKNNDSRLSDARTPLAHTHTISNITGLQSALDSVGTDKFVELLGDQIISGTKTFRRIIAESDGGGAIEMRSTSTENLFIPFYAKPVTLPGSRSGWLGWGSAANNDFYISNEIVDGAIRLQTAGNGVVNADAEQLQEKGERVFSPRNLPSFSQISGLMTSDIPQGPATNEYVHVATIDGVNSVNGASISVMIGSAGNIGSSSRATALVTVTNRGANNIEGKVWTFTSGTQATPHEYYTRRLSDYMFQLWIKRPMHDSAFRMSSVGSSRATWVASWRSTSPGDLVAIPGGEVLSSYGDQSISGHLYSRNLFLQNAGNTHIEMGRTDGVASQALIDFHTGSAATDFDARIIGDGGNASSGGGTLTLKASTVWLGNSSNVVAVNSAGLSILSGNIDGNGSGLTSLNASNLSSGTVPQARIATNVHREVFSSAGHARPTGVDYVEWIGPVRPTNAIAQDTWIDISAVI